MRENNLLSKAEAERLLAFTNNSGPLFIAGAVAVGMFNLPRAGMFLLVCHILACLTVGVLFRFYRRKEVFKKLSFDRNLLIRFRKELALKNVYSLSDLGGILGDAVRNSVIMMLNIGGFIIFFSVIINLLIDAGFINYLSDSICLLLSPLGIQKDIVDSLISGFFEITTGTSLASKAVNSTIALRLTAASAIIGWAGLSVHSQVLSIVSKTDISIKPYLLGKLLQGVLAAIYTFIGINISGSAFCLDEPVFSQAGSLYSPGWYGCFLFSFESLAAILSVFILGAAIICAASLMAKKAKAWK